MAHSHEALGLEALLSEEDALPEVVVARGHLLQAFKSEAQVQVESGPHLTHFSLGQCPWKMPTPHTHSQPHSHLGYPALGLCSLSPTCFPRGARGPAVDDA